MFDKKSLLKLKKLMITPESCLYTHSTLMINQALQMYKSPSLLLNSSYRDLEGLLELLEGLILPLTNLVLRIFPLCRFYNLYSV